MSLEELRSIRQKLNDYLQSLHNQLYHHLSVKQLQEESDKLDELIASLDTEINRLEEIGQ